MRSRSERRFPKVETDPKKQAPLPDYKSEEILSKAYDSTRQAASKRTGQGATVIAKPIGNEEIKVPGKMSTKIKLPFGKKRSRYR